MESYIIISFIGEGSFGRVFKARHKDTEAIVALKVIRKKGRSSKDLKSLRQECDIQRQLNHPNIIRMIDSFDTDSELVVVTEYAEKELHGILAKEGCLKEEQVKKITWDLVSALYYLHSHRVLHRDLKPQNVLLDSTGRAKLCDFGLARIMTNATHILTSIKGTPLYMAPELIDEKPYDHQADLWSLGCIVYELMAGQPPFCTMSIWQLVRMIRHKPVQWPTFISPEARSFLQGLLHKDPVKRMSWPEILEHPFVVGHILILPEDVQSESPFTKPLTHSQQEAKQLQKDKISNNTKLGKTEIETVKPEGREHDLRNVRGVMQAMECIPMSDDDSVRATSAFSVRDSLKTDDEDQSQPITAANAKLLRHEFNVMNNSNLVIGNLEKNMAQLMAANHKHGLDKMHKIEEEKHDAIKAVTKEVDIEVISEQEPVEPKPKPKSVDTASQSLENPKSSTKCSSEVSSGLSKSVPPSYKQKLLQFSRDKLRFGSGGNKLTRSIKRSFHFSRSWDRNKSDGQRRTSEPAIEIPSGVEVEKVKYSKEDKDEDIEKCEVIEDTVDEKEVANNDVIDKVDENEQDVKEPTAIELEEWEAFLNSNITEVMEGDVESLTQLNMVSMAVGVVGRGARGGRGARVCGALAALLALPALAPALPRHTLLNIQDVYLEAKVVYNFVAAINTLMKDCKDNDDGAEERFQGVSRMVEVCAWLCVRSCRAVRQFATAMAAYNAHPVFTKLLNIYSKAPRIGLNIIGILITVLQDLPEHAEVVEKILFDDNEFHFLTLLEQPSDALRMRICILISLLCTFSCTAFSAAMETKWRPWGLPILGYLPWMGQGAPHAWYLSLAERYGDVYSVKLGSNLIVCIGSPKLLRMLFNRLDSIGRPQTPLNSLLGGMGIVLSEGQLWRRQRHFLHEKFRSLGVKIWKNQRFEQYIIMEVEELLSELEMANNEPVDPLELLGRYLHNVICQLMMSFRFEKNDPAFKIFNERVSKGMNLYGAVHIGEHVPYYLKLPGKMAVMEEIKLNLEDISKFHEQHVKKRIEKRSNFDTYHESADLLDCYLDQIHQEKTGEAQETIFTDVNEGKQVVQVMNDLFSAGMETSRNTLVWVLVFMLREPKVAANVRAELAKVVNVGKRVTLEHRSKLPYLEAVIFETLRRVSVVPLGTTHVNTEAWRVNGYTIPADTHIVPLINKINMNPEFFPEPEIFKPERFIKGRELHLPDHFIPFGVGRRVCLGEQLARMELYLFFANLMNNFEIELPEGHEPPELQGMFGMTHSPLPYTVCFKKIIKN
ncbi:serine/threonine-protein kinase fused-like [Epargyreus clarus]|uniref:serine/threonine-protein kinase fused-like n=1 Tax=Epargyreus clarus TaxID=520877 RepID=UPI003C2FDE19